MNIDDVMEPYNYHIYKEMSPNKSGSPIQSFRTRLSIICAL